LEIPLRLLLVYTGRHVEQWFAVLPAYAQQSNDYFAGLVLPLAICESLWLGNLEA
jgi:hypothetical protein